jgi:hypothetical protein
MSDLAMKSDECVPTSPSASIQAVAKLAKKTSLDCASLLGGSKRGGPFPIWDESTSVSGQSPMLLSGTRKTGLFLDVERMFKETFTIYPHSSEIIVPSRDAAMFLFFKIVTRAWFEDARLRTFSAGGYMQIQVDAAFLKHIIPHYLSANYTESSTNGCTAIGSLISDVLEVVDDRCADESCCQNDSLQRHARSIVRSFLATVDSESSLSDLFVVKD